MSPAVQLIQGARAAVDLKDAALMLTLAEARKLEPVALTVMGIEFDCLAGRDCKDDPLEVWAVDVSGYWMRAVEMGAIADQLDAALAVRVRAAQREEVAA